MIELILSMYLTLAQATPDKAFPEGPLNNWYKSLKSPLTGLTCCDISDCEPVDWRIADDHYEVYIDNRWWTVPKGVVLENTVNPTGGAVACWSRYTLELDGSPKFYCFVPGGGV